MPSREAIGATTRSSRSAAFDPNRIPATPVPIMPRTTRRPTGLPSIAVQATARSARYRAARAALDLKLT